MDPSFLRLIAVTDRAAMGPDWLDRVPQALEGGVTAIWLREKDLTARDLYPIAQTLRNLTRARHAALIISDRADVAVAVGADAVHLGWTSLPVDVVCRVVAPRCSVGFSAHTLQEAEGAVQAGAGYLTYSPVFPTPSKEGLVPVVGLEGLREACARFPLPIVALGGIDPTNAQACREAGAVGVAAIRSIFCASDVCGAAGQFARLLGLRGP